MDHKRCITGIVYPEGRSPFPNGSKTMENTRYCEFFDLTMKYVAGQASDAEKAVLEEIIKTNTIMKREFDRLNRQTRLMIELCPLIEAVLSEPSELPPTIRQRLQEGTMEEIRLLKR
tara:strand:+ start:282 stop:632 length:351 start_codon:yes stop_codon:yes gene_type:complete